MCQVPVIQRPFPFAPSQLSPPFVANLPILITAPPWDGGFLIIAGINIYPPYDLCHLLSPEKKGKGVGGRFGTGDIKPNSLRTNQFQS